MIRAKLPSHPPADLATRTVERYDWPPEWPLWAVTDGAGPHARAFGQMRSFGPLPTARFDPHPEPAGDTSGELVGYAAGDLPTAIAERYQRRRAVTLTERSQPVVYAWTPTRSLDLLDLTGLGALRLGASHAINTGPRSVSRRWARALRRAWTGADGLAYSSSMTGRPCVALWVPAADSFPTGPDLALAVALRSPEWQGLIEGVCAELGYDY